MTRQVSRLLRIAKEIADVSEAEVARRAGLSRGVVSMHLCGRRQLSPERAARLLFAIAGEGDARIEEPRGAA